MLFLLLSGFDAGIEAEKAKRNQVKSSNPVLKYREPIAPTQSNQELYHQYHLLITTSLEEASGSVEEDQTWSLRMAQSAFNYIKLIKKLLKDEHNDKFLNLNKNLADLLDRLKKGI